MNKASRSIAHVRTRARTHHTSSLSLSLSLFSAYVRGGGKRVGVRMKTTTERLRGTRGVLDEDVQRNQTIAARRRVHRPTAVEVKRRRLVYEEKCEKCET